MDNNRYGNIKTIQWMGEQVRLLDQRLLPEQVSYKDLKTCKEVASAITDMVVRGAPAIGVTAAYAVVLAASQRYKESPQHWRKKIEDDLTVLLKARPTAVNLRWAVQRMKSLIKSTTSDPVATLLDEACKIHNEDIAANKQMGSLGAALIEKNSSVLTHCNAGALATGGYGTALGVIRSAWAEGKLDKVFADETRPWLQGSRLTAWELIEDKIPVTLVCEGAAASLMREQGVSWVIVGADRVAANGDVANKIGTYSLAVHARSHGVGFMVVAPTSTIDMQSPCGEVIEIEKRDPDEMLSFQGRRIAAQGAVAWNPVFDITPSRLVDALVTEKGVVFDPSANKLRDLMNASP